MTISSRNIRMIGRWIHIVVSSMLVAYAYSPTLADMAAYTVLVRFVAIPLAIITGTLMWQLPRINKWRAAQRKAEA